MIEAQAVTPADWMREYIHMTVDRTVNAADAWVRGGDTVAWVECRTPLPAAGCRCGAYVFREVHHAA